MTNNQEGSAACIALRATKYRPNHKIPVIFGATTKHVLIVKYV
jgi:hypothetical protein